MTRVLQILDQNSHQCTAQLDAILAAIIASNKNIAQNGQLLARNKQPFGPEMVWGLPPLPPLSVYQHQNVGMRAGGQGPNVLYRPNPTIQNYGFPLEPNVAQAWVPISVGNNNELYAQIEEAI
uniref:Uncharacterized protein n=1 Tax=Ananas comosus var. bracteatus TaxID=296719 RepID=A0A6V7Q6T4_ANACO|nr:unnamed protein product [Ananas comosus var. bracteatus]